MVTLIRNQPYDAVLSTIPAEPRVGEETTIVVEVRQRGAPVLLEPLGKMLHVVLASDNRLDFLHSLEFWEQDAEGRYTLPYTFTQPGRHRFWLEIGSRASGPHQHGKYADLIAYTDRSVGGDSALPASDPPASFEVVHDSVRTVRAQTTFIAGREATIRWRVLNEEGQPFPLTVYEPACFVIVGPGYADFAHGHIELPADDGTSAAIPFLPTVPGEYMLWIDTFFVMKDGTVDHAPARFWIPVREAPSGEM